ncbi:MAG: Holliday junction branch migration protein RuvA [Capsulimonadales bacterium]|nr:Holliday junction branch migration protein RuvA [Capsulimonadales bacterium]
MIAEVSGTVGRTGAGAVIVDVHGIGYRVNVPVSVLETLPETGQPIRLLTHLIVREDDLSLYGFNTEQELKVFQLLLTVSGIGPKAALALLSALPAEELAQAVSQEDVRRLTKVPGIGARTAQRLVVELKDKFSALGFERRVDMLASSSKARTRSDRETLLEDVASALENLGYNKNDARRAAEGAVAEKEKDGEKPEFALLLRTALNRLSK